MYTIYIFTIMVRRCTLFIVLQLWSEDVHYLYFYNYGQKMYTIYSFTIMVRRCTLFIVLQLWSEDVHYL
jgi:hypothetical protein